jgi:hypothetical protein
MLVWPQLAFATPRKLPKARDLRGRVVVVDIAFASEASSGGFSKITKPLIDGLGDRLAAWVDHHDHDLHGDYAGDPRFILATKAQHGACPEMVTTELVARIGAIDTIVCHTDFDGLCSAAKWINDGNEPYPGADDDARAIDTRIGEPSAIGQRFDRAIRARPRDVALLGLIVRHLATGLCDASLWKAIDDAGSALIALEASAREHARDYRVFAVKGRPWRSVALLKVPPGSSFDRTLLLLLGQQRADIAILVDRDTMTLAAPFDSNVNFLSLLSISGGMPTLVSLPTHRLAETLRTLGVESPTARDGVD